MLVLDDTRKPLRRSTRLTSARIAAASIVVTCILGGCSADSNPRPTAVDDRWWRGNLHTHSLWSDGDEYPEVILEWYKSRGYDFVAMSDHNTLAEGERWIDVVPSRGVSIERYADLFGDEWVETREGESGVQVRLKTFAEYQGRVEVPGQFIVIQSEEISDSFDAKPIHVNATNVREKIEPQGGSSVQAVLQNNVDAVLDQRVRTQQPMFPHINHPNFGWALTVEDMIPLVGERFFEVYNGHPAVHNEGDEHRPSSERIWDIVLAERLRAGNEIMYGIAVDDAHSYQEMDTTLANPGRAWVMVRADTLTPATLVAALEAGDFYASTGVVLEDVLLVDGALSVLVRPELGVRYRTMFVGTRAGYDSARVAVEDPDGSTTRYRYGDDIGEVFAESNGNAAHYQLRGDELYVRAVVISTKPKQNPYRPGEVEMAWTQPVVLRGR